jgi:hypothetical protein
MALEPFQKWMSADWSPPLQKKWFGDRERYTEREVIPLNNLMNISEDRQISVVPGGVRGKVLSAS